MKGGSGAVSRCHKSSRVVTTYLVQVLSTADHAIHCLASCGVGSPAGGGYELSNGELAQRKEKGGEDEDSGGRRKVER